MRLNKITCAAKRLLVLFLCSFTPAQGFTDTSAPPPPLNIVTSIKPLALITREIAGEAAVINYLLPATKSPHHLSFKPSDLKKLMAADLLIWFGPIEGSSLDNAALRLPDQKRLRLLKAHPSHETHNHTQHSVDQDRDNELHPWITPQDVIGLATTITEKLEALDPPRRADYRQRLYNLSRDMQKLDANLYAQLEPFQTTPFVAMHNAYDSLIHRYRLTLIALIQDNAHQAPGARHLKQTGIILNNNPGICLIADPFSPTNTLTYLQKHYDIHLHTIDLLGENVEDIQSLVLNIGEGFHACLTQNHTNPNQNISH
ncbi:MAG: zinc ABC transporter substrate-binding protein [Pseudomonadales bacterium]|nr:zinc ABC transporter substrate-binding protein [Pseudomonadales bacterium]